MASSGACKTESSRPLALHGSKSFSRIETVSTGSSTRSSRANTMQGVGIPGRPSSEKEDGTENIKPSSQNIFDKGTQVDKKIDGAEDTTNYSPIGVDELPIELKALTDRLDMESIILGILS